jgi:hypothetical protein
MARYRTVSSGGFGYGPRDFGGGFNIPRDVLVLLGILFATYTLSFLPPTRGLIAQLELSSAVWQKGHLWQLVTYAFVPYASPFWFLVSLFIIFLFAREVLKALGRRGFWRLLLTAVISASTLAVLIDCLRHFLGFEGRYDLTLLRGGDELLIMVLVAAFAVIFPTAVIRLYFVLPIEARHFIVLEVLFLFVLGFLPTLDYAGFAGLLLAIGVTMALLRGGVHKFLRETRLRIERRILEQRMKRMRRRSGLRVVKDDSDSGVHRGPWVH